MPSLVTHAFVGWSFSRFLPEKNKVNVLGTIVISCIPDIDTFSFLVGIPYVSPWGHRGFCHSILFAIIVTGFLTLFCIKKGCFYFKREILILYLAIQSHGILDAMTDAGEGIGFFIPFSFKRYFFPFRPIRTISVNPMTFFKWKNVSILLSEIEYVWFPMIGILILFSIFIRKNEKQI